MNVNPGNHDINYLKMLLMSEMPSDVSIWFTQHYKKQCSAYRLFFVGF